MPKTQREKLDEAFDRHWSRSRLRVEQPLQNVCKRNRWQQLRNKAEKKQQQQLLEQLKQQHFENHLQFEHEFVEQQINDLEPIFYEQENMQQQDHILVDLSDTDDNNNQTSMFLKN